MTHKNKRLLAPFLLLFLMDIAIVLSSMPEIRFVGTVGLLFFLPGWALLEALFPSPTSLIERILLAIGLSYSVSILGTLYLIYLPGPIRQIYLVGTLTLWVIFFQGIAIIKREKLRPWQTSQREWMISVILLGLVLSLRLPRLGYSEFHEDEVEVLSLVTRVLGGEDYAIFLHRKGPVQTLVPLMVWLNTTRVTEWIARFPFALASALGVMVIYLLTTRLSNRWAGLLAGLLLAINGLSIAFGRLVQYQAVILFLAPLAIWAFWYARLKKAYSWIIIGALFLAVCTLAHYDSLLYLPIILYLSGLIFKEAYTEAGTISKALKWFIVAGLLYIFVVTSFYLPYIQDPQFSHTWSYLTESRIGGKLFYNNLALFREVDFTYNSHFHLLILFLLAIVLPVKWSKTRYANGCRLSAIGLIICIGLVGSTYWFPKVWKVQGWNLALIPWLLWLILGWVHLRQAGEGRRVAWVWWLTSLMGYVFLVDKPGTHFYIAYPGWVAVAGMGFGQVWQDTQTDVLYPPKHSYSRQAILAAGALMTLAVLFYYQTILFWHTDSTYRQTFVDAWADTPLRHIYQSVPDSYGYFGAPRRLGWKAIGSLLNSGVIQGDYRSANEVFSVPIWYTYQTPRSCFSDPQNYFVAQPDGDRPEIIQTYTLVGNVLVEEIPRIAVFVKGNVDQQPINYNLADSISHFDRHATLANFIRPSTPQYPTHWRFGDAINFLGFSLSKQELLPGETLAVALQWQAIAPLDIPYRAFVHLEKDQIWGQHDDDPACRLPTNLWRTGQIVQGHFRIIVDPATPPGEYPLTIGLYNPDDWQRLPIFDGQDNEIGDNLVLTTIKIN